MTDQGALLRKRINMTANFLNPVNKSGKDWVAPPSTLFIQPKKEWASWEKEDFVFGVATPFMAMEILDNEIGIILKKLYAAKAMVVK